MLKSHDKNISVNLVLARLRKHVFLAECSRENL